MATENYKPSELQMDNFKLLSKTADEIGGDVAISYVDKNYTGNCRVIKMDGSGDCVAILPNFVEAHRVACYSITPDGGYGSVEVSPTVVS
jgi:hypothetical protein